jgi:CDP-diacylglycerol---glycerol-3-phosphate 3-phosphatidyltransferase
VRGIINGEGPRLGGQVNLPNYITLTRILSIPVLIWVLSSSRFSTVNGEKELLASALFIAASITDGIDGLIARKRGQITTIGMLLDPLADKLLIAAAFVTLVQFNPRLVPPWIAVIIIGREFLVSGLRAIAASEGFTIEASDLGKFKMCVQIVSVVAVILDHRWQEWPVGPYIFPVHWIAFAAIGFMVVLSLLSAGDYFFAFWRKIDRHVVKRRRRAFVLSRRKKRDVAAI